MQIENLAVAHLVSLTRIDRNHILVLVCVKYKFDSCNRCSLCKPAVPGVWHRGPQRTHLFTDS